MINTKKLSLIFDLFHCNHADIATYMECDVSNISKIRNGKLTYDKSSAIIKCLVAGIVNYAQQNELIKTLCDLSNIDNGLSEKMLKNALTNWLYDFEEGHLTSLNDAIEGQRVLAHFSRRIDLLIKSLNLSNVYVGGLLNVDPSYVSRLRRGHRTPKANNPILMEIVDLLAKEICLQYEQNDKINFLPIQTNIIENKQLLNAWLKGWLFECDKSPHQLAVDAMLKNIENHTVYKNKIDDNLHDVIPFEMLNSELTRYVGYSGFREAITRFFGNVILSKAREIYLYSDQNLDWLIGDLSFYKQWQTFLRMCLVNGTRIKVIHHLKRNYHEMKYMIESWIPLYFSDLIEPYYCPEKVGQVFSHTLFYWPENASLEACQILGKESVGVYHYLSEISQINQAKLKYEALLSKCKPLIKKRLNLEESYLSSKEMTGKIVRIQKNLPFETLSPLLLEKILDGARLTKRHKEIVLAQHRKRVARFETLVNHYEIIDVLPMPELWSDQINGSLLGNYGSRIKRDIAYSAVDFKAHRIELGDFICEHENYAVKVSKNDLPELFEIIVLDHRIEIRNPRTPFMNIIFTHPILVEAFHKYAEIFIDHASNFSALSDL